MVHRLVGCARRWVLQSPAEADFNNYSNIEQEQVNRRLVRPPAALAPWTASSYASPHVRTMQLLAL